ncbi:hypothetical protein BC831DRAFT_397976 [Entophlyctis helioformis]|nr:hypothetical protein BC831DRAFT_397976 [Entophlyctis helioformis]
MYNPNPVINNVVDVDRVYVQKLRDSIDEMSAIKQTAIMNEDYATADQMRLKTTALQFQLMKLEDQLNADILTNFVGISILQAPMHVDLVQLIKAIPRPYYDSILRSLLIISPHDLPDTPKSPYGWDFFAKKIPLLSSKQSDVVDSVVTNSCGLMLPLWQKSTVTLAIFDLVCTILGLSTAVDVRRETYDLVLRHAFNYFHATSLRRINPETEGRIFEKIFVRTAIVIGDVAEIARRDLYRYTLSYLDLQKKIAPEEIIMVLSSIRYISAKPKTDDEAATLVSLIRELAAFYDRSKKTPVKIAIIQALEHLIQPLDFCANVPRVSWESSLWNEIADVYKKARKWVSVDDDKSAALSLLVAVLVNARFDFFAQNIDGFINSDLFPKGKVKAHAYQCILQLLRGQYFVNTREHWRQRANGTFELGQAYASLTRAPEDQSPGSVANRLTAIAELVFFRRKSAIADEHLDICSDIVVQIAAHNFQIGLKLIADLMNTNSVDSGPDSFYIGVRALRTIVSPESGFSSFAYSKHENDFFTILKEFPYDLEVNITHILNYIDVQIGINLLGTAGHALDPSTTVAASQLVVPLTRAFSSDLRPQDDILAMLSSAIEISGFSTADESPAGGSPGSVTSPTQTNATTQQLQQLQLNSRTNGAISLNRTQAARLLREMPGPATGSEIGQGSKRDTRLSILDSYRISYRRDSELGLSPLVIPSFTQDASTKETNEKVSSTIREWLDLCRVDGKTPSKYLVASSLVDTVRQRKRTALKLKPEQRLAVRMFKEVVRLLPYVPMPELVGGNLFIGAYLNHILEDVASEAALSMRTIFERYPIMRTGIVNGFINYIKHTPHQDDISICTIVSFLAQLTNIWGSDFEDVEPIDEEPFSRVSCKVDAAMLILLARPCARIRKAGLQILLDLYTIQQSFPSFQITPREMPLASILVQMETTISKRAVFGFLEKGMLGHLLSPRLASALPTLTFLEVASSDYAALFRYFLGELAQRFASHGRSKATRHCAKFLRILAVPYITTAPVGSVDDMATFTGYMILIMALSGVPLVSEAEYSMSPQNDSHSLLFQLVRPTLPPLIATENFPEVKPVFESVYFLHPSVIQLFVSEMLQIYSEVRTNSAKIMNKRIIDNIIYALRRLAQSPQFEAAIEETSMFPTTLIDMYSEFVALATVPLGDLSFLTSGSVSRLKTAVNFCIIVQRFSEALASVKRLIQRRVAMSQDYLELERFEYSTWRVPNRRLVLNCIREWYEVILEVTPSMQVSNETRKAVNLRKKLLRRIGLSAEKLMFLGRVFEDDVVPANVLAWFTTLETNGYRVFTPELLYSYDEALGTVLANSYSTVGVHRQVFYEAVFEQILPRLDESPQQHLFGSGRRMSYAEDFFAGIHMLPPRTQEGDSPALVYPDISRDDAIKLRQHFGSLLFFGLFNLMNTSKIVRSRALIFVRELLQMFSPDDNFNVDAYFGNFTGAFYSNSGPILQPKILELSRMASQMFTADSGSFLWEAVRCYRSLQNQATPAGKPPAAAFTLIPSHRWVLELIVPWCRFADFSNLVDDVVNAEVFRFIMDVAFLGQPQLLEYASTCWLEVVRASENGQANVVVLVDMLIQVGAKFEALRTPVLALAATLSGAYPAEVATIIAYHLSSAAFPWRPDGGSPRRGMGPHVRDYLSVLQAAGLNGSEDPATNEYVLLCRSAVIMASELLRQNFEAFIPHLSALVNYVIVNLPMRLQDPSAATVLLVGLVEGFVSWTHKTGSGAKPEFQVAQENIRKIMGWFEAHECEICWDFIPAGSSLLTAKQGIPSKEFVIILLSIFSVPNKSLTVEITNEVLFWASEGFLSSDIATRAVEVYAMLLASNTSVPEQSLNPLTSRILDQLTILSQLESEVLLQSARAPISSPLSAPTAATPSQWDSLPKGKIGLKVSSDKLLQSIIRVHSTMLEKYNQDGQLGQHSTLFWPVLALLHLPTTDFSDLYLATLENLTYYIQHAGTGLQSMEFNAPFAQQMQMGGRFPGIQRLLLPALFSKSEAIQGKAFCFLLYAWLRLPGPMVDDSITGTLYTILYTLQWIFARLYDPLLERDLLSVVTGSFKEFLNLKHPGVFADLHQCLQAIQDAAESGAHLADDFRDELFDRGVSDFMAAFVPEYVNNMAEFLAQGVQIDGTLGSIAIRMTLVLWRLTGQQGFQNIGSLRSLVRRIPFRGERRPEIIALYRVVLQDKFEGMSVKDLDLVSQGRVEAFPDAEPVGSSVRMGVAWLASDLGIKTSNNVFTALLQ